jgi:hypothetical protein
MSDSTAESDREAGSRPPFLWDYDLSEAEVRAILREPGLSARKRWLIQRILSEARFDEVVQYLDLTTIRNCFRELQLPANVRQRWQYALDYWSKHG